MTVPFFWFLSSYTVNYHFRPEVLEQQPRPTAAQQTVGHHQTPDGSQQQVCMAWTTYYSDRQTAIHTHTQCIFFCTHMCSVGISRLSCGNHINGNQAYSLDMSKPKKENQKARSPSIEHE